MLYSIGLTLSLIVAIANANMVLFSYESDACAGDPGKYDLIINPPCEAAGGASERTSCRNGRVYTTTYTSADCSGTGTDAVRRWLKWYK